MIKNKKTITIITAHSNDIKGLLKTWKSIKSQTFNSWYWIIVDSFTDNLRKHLPIEILKSKCINIYQINSSIYEAMNFGILKVKTDYFHFLNCNSVYSSPKVLKELQKIINSENKYKTIHSFQLEIIFDSGKFIQKPSKLFYPFNSGHESTIFPTMYKNKLTINTQIGVVADFLFMSKYQSKYDLKCHQKKFIQYPKGGYSDNPLLVNEKLKGYVYLLFYLSKKLKFFPVIFCIKRILSQVRDKYILFSK